MVDTGHIASLSLKRLIVGNWKMNHSLTSAAQFISQFKDLLIAHPVTQTEIAICPPFLFLPLFADYLHNVPAFSIGAQNCHSHHLGAFTGEISASMLTDFHCKYVLIGHSERRLYAHEKEDDIKHKVAMALSAKLEPIVCIGETLEAYQAGNTNTILTQQLVGMLPIEPPLMIHIAYEPVWAIGSGLTPSSQEIQEVNRHIANVIYDFYNSSSKKPLLRILYGGSITPKNIQEILSLADVSGVLVGGCSLKLEDFWQIIQHSETLHQHSHTTLFQPHGASK